MKLHEYQAAQVFVKSGIPTGGGKVAVTAEEALGIAKEAGYPVVLKSQVLVGGRGKAGGVKVAKDEKDLREKFGQIYGLDIKGYKVKKILVVHALDIKKEFYTAVTIDNAKNDVVLIASAAGGVDIEETAHTNPAAIKKYYLQNSRSVDPVRFASFIQSVFPDANPQAQAENILPKLINCFFENDCSLAEINPLIVDGTGKLIAADAKINIDDNALYRHADIAGLQDMEYEDADEIEAKKADLSFVKLDGNVGCVVNGAGLAMATLDVVKFMGGDPANFLDVGGSSNPEKVLNALRIILRNKNVKSILINIFGGITRCDDIANGLVAARHQLKFTTPLAVRLTGTNEDLAKEILAKEGISTFSTMREAVQKAVELAK